MKKCLLMAAMVAVVSTGAALGQSSVNYTLGLGGDNRAAEYEGVPPIFPQFDTTVAGYTESDGKVVNVTLGDVDLTWSVKVEVTGSHNGTVAPSGLANFAFSLELRDGNGDLVPDVIWHSTINDGDDDGVRGYADPVHWAAFTFTYNIYDSGIEENGPGRVFDTILPQTYPHAYWPKGENYWGGGGPGLSRIQYPSKKGASDDLDLPLAAAAPVGTLMGMGAGYPEYIPAQLNDTGEPQSDYYFGVGMASVVGSSWSYDGLGVVPLAEGQMNLCGLDSGTYTLKLISSKNEANVSNNILEGDLDPDWELLGHFAALANQVVESEITFIVNNDGTCGCQDDSDCDDENLCTVDACVETVCQNTPVECPEGEVCDPETGECVAPPECENDEDCEDGDLCTTDTCVDGTCTFPPVDCGEDICDPDTGECVECLTNDDCAEGEECVEGECVVPCTNPILVSGASVMRHGTTVDYSIAINKVAPYTTEPRVEGTISQHRLKFVFDQAIDISAAVVTLSSGSYSTLTVEGGNTLVATMSSAPTNNACLIITVSGVKSLTGGCTMAPTTLKIRMHKGNVDLNTAVNTLDLNAVKAVLFNAVGPANFTKDVDANGAINTLDLNAVKGNLFGAYPNCGT